MADQNPAEAKEATTIPERPKEAVEGEEKGPSKAALKKAAKDKEKVCMVDLRRQWSQAKIR